MIGNSLFVIRYSFLWLSGNLQLNTPDSYLTTKNTKIMKEE